MPSITIGATQQFAVTGSFSDGATRDVTAVSAFASASPATASIAAGGLGLGKVAGTTQITATTGTLTASTSQNDEDCHGLPLTGGIRIRPA